MAAADDTLEDRFLGCLLGLAIGDALGGKFEAQDAEAIRQRFPTSGALMGYPQEEIWDTDSLAFPRDVQKECFHGDSRFGSCRFRHLS